MAAEAHQACAFQSAVNRTVQNGLAELHVFNNVAICTIDAPPLTVPVA